MSTIKTIRIIAFLIFSLLIATTFAIAVEASHDYRTSRYNSGYNRFNVGKYYGRRDFDRGYVYGYADGFNDGSYNRRYSRYSTGFNYRYGSTYNRRTLTYRPSYNYRSSYSNRYRNNPYSSRYRNSRYY